jgi:hypothetical protein
VTRRLLRLELRHALLRELDDEWRTPTELADSLGLDHGVDWFKVALVLERLANDGEVELKGAGTRVRRFRQAA